MVEQAKLTVASVKEIRNLHSISEVSQTILSERFGVSRSLIGQVIDGKIWKHVK